MVRQLQRNETLVYFDMPQLFYASDPIGLDYRCLLVSTDEKEDTYLCTPISLPRLKQFLYGFLDLRIVFENPETQDFFIGKTCGNLDTVAVFPVLSSDIPPEWYPEAGFFLPPSPLVLER